MHRQNKQLAFSLVELSIVLVILGLLTGGILAGQSLIRASELRSVGTDLNRYIAATHAFQDRYFALPGDMANATKFWGVDGSGCPNGGGATGTCDGNGNAQLGDGGVGNICEPQEYWRQLGRAGIIEGSYTPNTAASCYDVAIPGRNSGKLRVANGGVTAVYVPAITVNNAVFPNNLFFVGSYKNVFLVGTTSVNHLHAGYLFKPEEQWNIDTKLDDGKPATGSLTSIYPGTYGPAPGATGCVTTSTTAADYSLSNTSTVCSIVMRSGF